MIRLAFDRLRFRLAVLYLDLLGVPRGAEIELNLTDVQGPTTIRFELTKNGPRIFLEAQARPPAMRQIVAVDATSFARFTFPN